MITDLANLSLHHPYEGSDDVEIGDGNGLTITHTRSLQFVDIESLHFPTALLVPTLSKNLISVSQLCRDNNVVVVFSNSDFQVKDSRTGGDLLQGPRVNGLYLWPAMVCTSSTPTALSSVRQSQSIWHARLGHPSTKILDCTLSRHYLPFTKSVDFNCDACKCVKSHKLPFIESSLSSTAPLELIYSDVWTSPVLSFDGFKYYVIFVYHFTKYVWLYPLTKKYDVLASFTAFKALVENFFKTKIATLYSEMGANISLLDHF